MRTRILRMTEKNSIPDEFTKNQRHTPCFI